MTIKHTPGPWKWSKNKRPRTSEAEFKCLDGPNNEDIISLQDVFQGYAECGEELVMSIDRCNANLIVSAPDMLFALEQCVEYGLTSGVQELVLSAIKKAKGE